MSGLRKSPAPEEDVKLGVEVEYVYEQVCSPDARQGGPATECYVQEADVWPTFSLKQSHPTLWLLRLGSWCIGNSSNYQEETGNLAAGQK
jgi:hypothetical protein